MGDTNEDDAFPADECVEVAWFNSDLAADKLAYEFHCVSRGSFFTGGDLLRALGFRNKCADISFTRGGLVDRWF